jgi:hypothetical protein
MAVSYYERKVIQKTIGMIDTLKFKLNFISAGTKDGKRAVCAVLDPQTKEDEIEELITGLSKCFRKAEVVKGAGAHKQYAQEINYPTIYIMIKGANR